MRFENLEPRQLLAVTPVAADWMLQLPAGTTVHDTAVDAAGDFLVVGKFSGTVDFDPGAGSFELTSSTSPDLFVAKYDAMGALVAAADIGDINIGVYNAPQIAVDGAGDVYISAPYNDSALLMNGQTLPPPSIGRPNTLFAKISSDLQTMSWATHAAPGPWGGYSGSFDIRDLTVDASGTAVYGVGDMSGETTFGALQAKSNLDGFALQIDADNGTFTWVNTTLGVGFVNGVAVDPADSTAIFMHSWEGTLNGATSSVLRVDASGNAVWKRLLPDSTSLPGNWSDIDARDGDVYLAGSFSDQATFDQTTLIAEGDRDALAVRFDGGTGSVIWAVQAGGTGDDMATGISVDSAGNLFLAGSFEATAHFGGDTLGASTVSDVFFSQIDTLNGDFVQSWRYGEATIGTLNALGGSAYVTGTFNDYSIDFPTGDVPVATGSSGNYLIRFDAATGPTVPRINGLSASPYPAEKGYPIELSVTGMHDPDGRVGSVAFYHDVDGNRQLDAGVDSLLGTDSDGADGWSFDAPTAALPLGDVHFLAQAIYDGAIPSLATSAATWMRLPSTTYVSTDVGQRIRDLSTVTSTLQVPDSFTLGDVDVKLTIEHTANQDLDVYLIHPDGTRVELFTDIGGAGADNNNITDTTLDDQARSPIEFAQAPFTGTFRPEGLLSDLQGKNSNGTWILEVTDDARKDTGTLVAWSLDLAPDAPVAPTLSIDDISVTEGDGGTTTATFLVTRSGDTSPAVSVDFTTTDGTATAVSDYTSTAGTITFASGEVSKTINVAVLGDVVEESDETFFVELSNANGATIADPQAVATIIDDDAVSQLIDVYIADIRFDSKRGGKDWRAVVEVLTVDGDAPVAGVTLKVDFAGTTYTLITDSSGIARTSWEKDLASDDYYADAYDLALADPEYSWIPFAFDLEDDSDNDGWADELLTV